MVLKKAFHVAQIQEAEAEAIVALVLRQPQQPLDDPHVLCDELELKALSTRNEPKRLTRHTDAQALLPKTAHLATSCRRDGLRVFASASATISALI
jgi:hypothetical protein